MRVLILSLCFLALAHSTTVSVAPEQQCLEDFISLTQGWFHTVASLDVSRIDGLLTASIEWGRTCNESEMEEFVSAKENEKVRSMFGCLRALKSLPGKLKNLVNDVMTKNNIQLAVDGYSLLQTIEALVLNCGL